MTQNQAGMTVNKCRLELETQAGSAFQGKGRPGRVPVYKRHGELAAGGEGLVGRITLSDSGGHFHFWLNSVIGI